MKEFFESKWFVLPALGVALIWWLHERRQSQVYTDAARAAAQAADEAAAKAAAAMRTADEASKRAAEAAARYADEAQAALDRAKAHLTDTRTQAGYGVDWE